MARITRFMVEGLFQNVTHNISFATDGPVTILAGPNGVGKTHILKLIQAALLGDVHALFPSPFRVMEISSANDRTLRITKEIEEGAVTLTFEGLGPRGGRIRKEVIREELFLDPIGRRPYIRVLSGRWLDRRSGELLPQGVVPPPSLRQRPQERHRPQEAMFMDMDFDTDWVRGLFGDAKSILIDTKRLDTVPVARQAGDAPPSSVSRINEYMEAIQAQVSDARRASLLESQAADQSFAARVLKKTRKAVPESSLKRRYEEIAERHAELHRSGLSGGTVDFEFPSSGTDATERRILAVFLNDWARKLEPFKEVNDKLTVLRRIVNGKFLNKSMKLDKSGSLEFVSTIDGSAIPVRSLSSGEQHLLALFTMLLFSAASRSIVLIDEPEISLHAGWKHDFLKDIEAVAQLADLQVILATHSSGIINGQWDIVRELGAEE